MPTATARLIPRGVIEDVLSDANIDIEHDTVRTDYRGPRPAFGVVLHDLTDFARFMFGLGEVVGIERDSDGGDQELADQIRALVEAVRVDSMGRDLIAYFSGFELTT